MTLDPETRPIMEALAAAPKLSSAPLAEGRRAYDGMRVMGFAPDVAEGETRELALPGPGGSLRTRLYRPRDRARRGLLVHVHGGGFVAGSIEGYDPESRAFAGLGECSVLTFDYRLAPEHPFPAAFDDTCAVLAWASENARELGCDPDLIAIVGDSVGGNLAAAAALWARERGLRLVLQLLIYPNVDYACDYASREEFADLPSLTKADAEWARDQYLGPRGDRCDWRASPFRASSLKGAAPALLLTAGCDVLRDEAEAYADRLRAEDVPVELRRYAGLPHGFFSMGAFVSAARRAVEETCRVLQERLA